MTDLARARAREVAVQYILSNTIYEKEASPLREMFYASCDGMETVLKSLGIPYRKSFGEDGKLESFAVADVEVKVSEVIE